MNRIALALLASVSVLLTACGNQNARKEITETRAISPTPVSPHGPDAEKPPAMDIAGGAPEHTFTWTAPEGWTTVQSTPMRIANFRIGSNQEAECYVSVLKGTGGGVKLNIDRWRDQMGVEGSAVTDEEMAALPKIKVGGLDAPLVEVAGEFRGMTGKAQANYMLLGTICTLGNESVFVKMVGPESMVKTEREKFIAFCGSLK